MAALLLRIEGPMQSWGLSSRFTERDTAKEPTKSGIVGLISAAMGRPRDAPINDLTSLKIGIRVDREGAVMRDFQTAENVPKASDTKTKKSVDEEGGDRTSISNRYYLADACFLVVVEGSEDTLHKIGVALKKPIFPLFLGRKAFVPSEKILLSESINHEGLDMILSTYPWLGRSNDVRPKRLRVIVDSDAQTGEERLDVPLLFSERTFAPRYVKIDYIEPSWGEP